MHSYFGGPGNTSKLTTPLTSIGLSSKRSFSSNCALTTDVRAMNERIMNKVLMLSARVYILAQLKLGTVFYI